MPNVRKLTEEVSPRAKMVTSVVQRLSVAAMTIEGLLLGNPAEAQDYSLTLNMSTQYDDNLQRLTKDRKSVSPNDGADIITLIGTEANIRTDLRAVMLDVNGTLAKRFFFNNSSFNSTEYRLAVHAKHEAANGMAAVDVLLSRQNLSFNDPVFRATSVRNLRRISARGDRSIVGDIRLAGALSFQSSTSPDQLLKSANNERYSYSAGLSYVSPISNRIELGYSRVVSRSLTDALSVGGDQLGYSSDSVDETFYGHVQYAISPLLSLDAQTGYTWHDDKSGRNADFQGVTHLGSVVWNPLPAVTVTASSSKSFSSNDELFANGVKSNSYSLAMRGRASSRFMLEGGFRYTERNFRYDIRTADASIAPRTDRFSVWEIGAEYETGVLVALGLKLRRTVIKDSTVTSSIMDNSVILTARKTFFR